MSSEPGSVTFTATAVTAPAVVSCAPFQVAPAACRVAVGATFAQRAVNGSVRVPLRASVAVMVTGRLVSSPRAVAVQVQVPAPLVRVPVDAVRVTASASGSPQVPETVSALPSGAAAGGP